MLLTLDGWKRRVSRGRPILKSTISNNPRMAKIEKGMGGFVSLPETQFLKPHPFRCIKPQRFAISHL